MKKVIIIAITILMFFFKNTAVSNYEKIFFNFSIKSISGDIINFKDYENKVILMGNIASFCCFTKQFVDFETLWC